MSDSTRTIAVSSAAPGGLNAEPDAHFGHCPTFTLVDLDDQGVIDVRIVPNTPHEHGDCAAAVGLLADHSVTALITGGMGANPLRAFRQAGIDVFLSGLSPDIDGVVKEFINGKLLPFGQDHICTGDCGNH